MARPGPALPLLGWREWIALPDLGIAQIKAKVDTGAATSALHALDIEPFRKGEAEWVRFTLQPIQRADTPRVRLEAALVESKRIRSSSGRLEERYTIRTAFAVAGVEAEIELTLTERAEMGFRMLLGRRALKERFLVDPGRAFQAGKWRGKRTKPEVTAS